MYKFSYTSVSTNSSLPVIGNGTSGDFNGDKIPDIVFMSNMASTVNYTASPVSVYVFDASNNKYTPITLTIDNIPNSLPQVFFGRDFVATDINRDGITDLIPIDQNEIPAPNRAIAEFAGNPQFAYISNDIGNYSKVSLETGAINPHGFGVIDSADGVFRLVLNTPWTDYRPTGTATTISSYNTQTGKFDTQFITRQDSYFTTAPQNGFAGYFYTTTVDVNNDGNTDIIGFSTPGGMSNTYLNNGQGKFTFSKSINTGLATGIVVEESTVGDFNGDGYQDVAVFAVNRQSSPATESKSIRILINDGKGGLTDQTVKWIGNQFQNANISFGYLDTLDINSDGRSDFVVPFWTGNDFSSRANRVFVSTGNEFEVFNVPAAGPRVITISDNQFVMGNRGGSQIYTLAAEGGAPVVPVPKIAATYDATSANYVVELGANTNRLVSKNDNSYFLLNKDVDRIKFNDTMVALDVDGSAGQAYRLYAAALNRAPDRDGLGYWINAFDNDATLTSVANGFINSAEFLKNFNGNGSNSTFVNAMYNNVLDRAPDQPGFEYWVNVLNNGTDRASVLIGFSESVENVALTANLIKNGIQYDQWIG